MLLQPLKYILLSLGLIVCLDTIAQSIDMEQFPAHLQLYPRDIQTDSAIITISGHTSDKTIKTIYLHVKQNASMHQSFNSTPNWLADSIHTFTFAAAIPAQLTDFNFFLYTVNQQQDSVLQKSAISIVAGDAFIVQGQSNAAAKRRTGGQSANHNQHLFIRTLGTTSDNQTQILSDNRWHIAESDNYFSSGAVGQWPLGMARALLDSLNYPIAIFNGAHGGKAINFFQRNDGNVDDLNTNYGRLLYRINQAQLANDIRAFFWYQGETDGLHGTSAKNYEQRFHTLYQDWQLDYPNTNLFYIFQVRYGCFNIPIENTLIISEAQRQLADSISNLTIISSTNLEQYTDNCHYDYPNGQERTAKRVSDILLNDFYELPASNQAIYPPNIKNIHLTPSTPPQLMLVVRDSTAKLNWDLTAERDFRIDDPNVKILAGSASNDTINLVISNRPTTNTNITYQGHIGAGPWITNQNGLGLLLFYKLPITDVPHTSLRTANYTPLKQTRKKNKRFPFFSIKMK